MNPETTAANPSASVPSAPEEKGVRRILITPPPYEIEVPVPDLDRIVIEDNTPLDNIFMEKQERLLTEPLYSNWPGPGEGRPFQVFANVGLFHTEGQEGLAPDIMLAIDAR